MIGLKIKGEWLDLTINASTQIERNTPLIITNDNLGEFSFPQSIKATPKNVRLLGFITELGKIKSSAEVKIHAEYYEYNLLLYTGTLVAEYVNINLNNPEQGEISIYFLTAISAFYNIAKGVYLHQLDLGGDRNAHDFRNYVADTWTGNADTHDFVFAPIVNEALDPYEPDPDTEIPRFMNPVAPIDDTIWIALGSNNVHRVTPFIYYKYLIIRCFAHFGYTVSGDLLQDIDFIKTFLPNFYGVYWGYVWQETVIDGGIETEIPHIIVNDPVIFNLRDHVPRNYTVTKFLFSFANRFAIAYDIDIMRKHCTIRRLSRIFQEAERKDYTKSINPAVKSEITKEATVYAIKQVFDDKDTIISTLDLSSYRRLPDVNTTAALPAAGVDYDNVIILVIDRNWIFVCQVVEDSTTYTWSYLCDYIHDYEPFGNNQTIETSITPVCERIVSWRRTSPADPYIKGLFPQIEQTGNWVGKLGEFQNWELRILFYHGLRADADGKLYPFASSHHYDYAGVQVGAYSLTLNAPGGMIETFWKNWLQILQSGEVVDILLYLTLKQYIDLSWTDIVLIRNTPFLITQQTRKSPYDESLPCKALRINMQAKLPVPVCVAEVGSITTEDVGGAVNVSWDELTAGATAWTYSVDGGAPVMTYVKSIVLFGLTDGAHSITVVPYCTIDNPNVVGAVTEEFDVSLPEFKIRISAVLTTGRNPFNKMALTATVIGALSQSIAFKFGQCTFNDSTPTLPQQCNGFPGAPNPGQYQTIIMIPGGVTSESAESLAITPGADFGHIVKVVLHGLVQITADQIEKDPAMTWTLEIL